MNDLHHAKDAYLNIVVGNSYYTKFTKNAAWFIKENPGRSYNLKMMFKGDKDIIRNGEVAWKAGNNGTIVTVKNVMKKNNCLLYTSDAADEQRGDDLDGCRINKKNK